MDNTYSTPFSKAILTGLFVGMASTLLCMIYNWAFRESVTFSPTILINVSSLIFVINLVFLVIGFIYYEFLKLKKGEVLYIIFFMVLTALLAYLANNVQRFDIEAMNFRFHELLVPIVVICGIAAAFGIPLLWHSKSFEEHII